MSPQLRPSRTAEAGLALATGSSTRHRCPEERCAVAAAETERYVLESTDGPVEHVVVACAAGHRFHGAVSSLWQSGR